MLRTCLGASRALTSFGLLSYRLDWQKGIAGISRKKIARMKAPKNPPPFDPWRTGYLRPPARKGIVLKCVIRSPKKPDSGKRKCVFVAIRQVGGSVRKLALVPGIGHSLSEFAKVLVYPRRRKDLPTVRLLVVRGALDCAGVRGRVTAIKQYGVKLAAAIAARAEGKADRAAAIARR